jgi:hypothetical protein
MADTAEIVKFNDDLYLILHDFKFKNPYKLDTYLKDSPNLNEKFNFKYLDRINCNLYFKYSVKSIFKYPYEFNHHLYVEVANTALVCLHFCFGFTIILFYCLRLLFSPLFV